MLFGLLFAGCCILVAYCLMVSFSGKDTSEGEEEFEVDLPRYGVQNNGKNDKE